MQTVAFSERFSGTYELVKVGGGVSPRIGPREERVYKTNHRIAGCLKIWTSDGR